MVTVIIAQFTDAQEATNFLLRAIGPDPTDFAAPAFGPLAEGGYPFGMGQTMFGPRPVPINVPLTPPPASSDSVAAHAMQAMSGADQDRVAENAALDGESVVPPAVTVPPPNPVTDLYAMPRTVPTPPPNTPVDPNGF